jgi:hypothetical protein
MIVATPAGGRSLGPVDRALAGIRRRRGVAATAGLAPGLLVPAGSPGWTPASGLLTGGFLDELLVAAKQRWNASPQAAAALAWRSYTYWLVLPVVLGWATARRVPLLEPDDVLVRIPRERHRPLLAIGLRRLRWTVRAGDPLAAGSSEAGGPLVGGPSEAGGAPELTVVGSDAALLGELRASLRDRHLDPLLAQLQTLVNLGTRTLLGSLASGVAYGVVRGLQAPPAELTATADTLLSALDVADLVALEPGPDGLSVQRRTCCLAFTLPEPKICSGCCLRPAP